MASSRKETLEQTKRIMERLVKMPPKPHEESKVGKRKSVPKKKPTKKRIRG